MNEKDWDRTAATFNEDVFNVPANDRQGLILRSIRRYAGKDKVAAELLRSCAKRRQAPSSALALAAAYCVAQACHWVEAKLRTRS